MEEVSFDLLGKAGSFVGGGGGRVVVSDQSELGTGYGQNLIVQETNLFGGNGVPCCHGNQFKKGSACRSAARGNYPGHCGVTSQRKPLVHRCIRTQLT